jgi:acyl dehydratase
MSTLNVPIGTLEDARAMVGYTSEPVKADVPVERGLVLSLLAILEDPNPSYWDPEYSKALWGHEIAPPCLLTAVFTALRWSPRADTNPGTIARSVVPLPGSMLINVSSTITHHRQLRIGDWLSRAETLVEVSEEKRTRLGVGHFVTTRMRYVDQDGGDVAYGTNVLLRYSAE